MARKDDLILHNIGKLMTFIGSGPVPGAEMDRIEVIEGAALAVSKGTITHVGKEDAIWKVADLSKRASCIDCEGRCVVPGFIDPHTHAVFSGTREQELGMKLKGASYMDILRSGGGILRTVRETRSATLQDLVRQMDARLDMMMAYGTTTAEIKSGYGLDRVTELKLLRAIKTSKHPVNKVATFMGPHAVPPEYRGKEEEFIDLMIGLLPEIKEEGLAAFADIFCEKGVFDAKLSRKFLTAARGAGLSLKIHSDEIENIGGTLVGAELNAASADHLLVSTEKDLRALKRSGTVPVLLPATLMTLFEDRVPMVREMLAMGLPVALATDLNPNCMVPSMQFVQALACYRFRMTPEQVLAASTVNAAHAVGLSARKGRLASGYDADILVLKDRSFEHVVYAPGTNHVDKVIIGGRMVVDGAGC